MIITWIVWCVFAYGPTQKKKQKKLNKIQKKGFVCQVMSCRDVFACVLYVYVRGVVIFTISFSDLMG